MKIYLLLFMSLVTFSCHNQVKPGYDHTMPIIRDDSSKPLVDIDENGDTIRGKGIDHPGATLDRRGAVKERVKYIIDVDNRLGKDDDDSIFWVGYRAISAYADKNGRYHIKADAPKSDTMFGFKNLPPVVFILNKDTFRRYNGDTFRLGDSRAKK